MSGVLLSETNYNIASFAMTLVVSGALCGSSFAQMDNEVCNSNISFLKSFKHMPDSLDSALSANLKSSFASEGAVRFKITGDPECQSRCTLSVLADQRVLSTVEINGQVRNVCAVASTDSMSNSTSEPCNYPRFTMRQLINIEIKDGPIAEASVAVSYSYFVGKGKKVAFDQCFERAWVDGPFRYHAWRFGDVHGSGIKIEEADIPRTRGDALPSSVPLLVRLKSAAISGPRD